MNERLEAKIDEVLEFILSKPAEKITGEQFAMMASQLTERRMREDNERQRGKNVELFRQLAAFPGFCG